MTFALGKSTQQYQKKPMQLKRIFLVVDRKPGGIKPFTTLTQWASFRVIDHYMHGQLPFHE